MKYNCMSIETKSILLFTYNEATSIFGYGGYFDEDNIDDMNFLDEIFGLENILFQFEIDKDNVHYKFYEYFNRSTRSHMLNKEQASKFVIPKTYEWTKTEDIKYLRESNQLALIMRNSEPRT